MINKRISVAVIIAILIGCNIYLSKDKFKLSGLILANVEALANSNESSAVTHTLNCGSSGVKACTATCVRCNVKMTNYGDGKSSTFTCSRD